MSWLARSLVNSLKPDVETSSSDEDDDDNHHHESNRTREESSLKKPNKEEEMDHDHDQIDPSSSSSEITGRGGGVKEDLSELTKTFTRQLWGVASFLAPPSESSSPQKKISSSTTDPEASDWNRWDSSDQQSISGEEISDSGRIAGIRSDFAEIGGRFKTGISKLSNHKAVSEISKIASSFLPFGSDENSDENYLIGDVVGVTEESVVFARNITMHPETWLDFPLVDDDDSEDFDMSDAQQEHALAVERLAPRLAALRMQLSPGYMSEGTFWKIYFVLLHSRLSKHDAELLSTPQIVEARAMLTRDIQDKPKRQPDHSGRDAYISKESTDSLHMEHPPASSSAPAETMPLETFGLEPKSSVVVTDFEAVKHPVETEDMKIIDKSIVEEPTMQVVNKEPEMQKEPAMQVVNKEMQKEPPAMQVVNKEPGMQKEPPAMQVVNKEPEMQNENKAAAQTVLHQTDEEGNDWLHESLVIDEEPTMLAESKEPVTQNENKGATEKVLHQTDEEDGDDWLHESSEMGGFTGTNIPIGNDEDVSFSDLEDDDEDEGAKVKPSSRTAAHSSDSNSTKDPRDWVQLSRSSDDSGDDIHHSIDSGKANKPKNKVPKDWLNVDEQHCKTPL